MEDIIQLLPNTFIIRTQAGFNKLLKHLGCHTPDKDCTISRPYHYICCQHTNDENAFFLSKEEYKEYDENGNLVYDENGNVKTYRHRKDKQYPIKYPCMLSYQDDTFEVSTFYFYIRYLKDDLTIKELTPAPEISIGQNIETKYEQ